MTAHRALPQSDTWDHTYPVDTIIGQARYAILRPGLVELVMAETQDALITTTITYAQGLCYAADATIDKDLAQSQGWDFTRSWPRCEAHLKP